MASDTRISILSIFEAQAMMKGGKKYKTDRRENTAPRKLTTMESGLPFQTQERIKRTKEIYHLSNNSLETQFTGAVFIATCLHHI